MNIFAIIGWFSAWGIINLIAFVTLPKVKGTAEENVGVLIVSTIISTLLIGFFLGVCYS